MTQTDPEYDPDETDLDEGTDLVRNLRKQLKEANRRGRDLEAQVAQGVTDRKKLAFLEADLPKNPQVEFYMEHYDGDLSSDAIRQDALTRGFLQPEDHSDEAAAHEQISAAQVGAQNLDAPDDALREAMAKVRPGPNASFEIEQILRQHGRQTAKDFT